MFRTIALSLMLLGCCLLSGCGQAKRTFDGKKGDMSKVPTGARDVALMPDLLWTLEPGEMTFPDHPVSGLVCGKPFTPDSAHYSDGVLRFRQGREQVADAEIELPLDGRLRENLEGKRLTLSKQTHPFLPALVLISRKPDGSGRNWEYCPNYTVKLECDRAVNGRTAARIYLCIADLARSFLVGFFTLETGPTADPSRPPDAQDAPYVGGTIEIKGAAKEKIEIGYLGQPRSGDWIQGRADCPLQVGVGVSMPANVPRTTRLHVPSSNRGSFLSRRLPPGRYLFFAGCNERMCGWRWVDVADEARMTIDFTLDPSQAGELKITLPPGLANESVWLVPLEAGGQFPSLPFPPGQLAQSLRLEAKVRDNEAQLDRLLVGAYRLLVGDRRTDVEIRQGTTTRVDLKAR